MATLLLPEPARAADRLDPARRCLAIVGYAEASSEGMKGMAAVIRVMHNRVRDPRFPDHPCKVARQKGQFQAVEESARIKRALAAPHKANLELVLLADTSFERMVLDQARRLASDRRVARGPDPTGGALYFVNPDMMDPSRCPWFAKLKRTTRIGDHVFMRHYRKGEKRGAPALDCRTVGQGWYAQRGKSADAQRELAEASVKPIPVPRPRPTVVASR